MKTISKVTVSILFSFLSAGYAVASEIACDKPKENGIETLPLSFFSVATVPSTIPVGTTVDLDYVVENNTSSVTMLIDSTTTSVTGSPTGQTSLSFSSGCAALAPGSHDCTITVAVTPTQTGAATLTLSVNYKVGSAQSCFQPITSPIDYTAGASTFAYISNSASSGGFQNTVTTCGLTTAGAFSGCGDSGVSTAFNSPAGIAIPAQTFTGNTYAYVANNGNNTVSQCLLNTSTGALSSCGTTGSAFTAPYGIGFNTATGGGLFSYVTDFSTGDITKCTTNTGTGSLGTCGTALTSVLNGPVGITTQTVNSGANTYAYIADSGNATVSQCAVSTAGKLVNCVNSGASNSFSAPQDVAFFTSSALFAYVTDSTATAKVSKCAVNTTTGVLSSCATTASGLTTPAGIQAATVGSGNYAYIADFSDNSLVVCTIDGSNGNLTPCNTDSLVYNFSAAGVAEQTFSGTDYMYIINTTTDFMAPDLLQCKVYAPNGLLYCVDSGVGNTVFSAFSISVRFQSVGGTIYGYVTDGDTIWLCSVNQTTGVFTGCVNGGPLGFNTTYDVAFGTVNSTLYAYVSDSGYGTVFQCEVDVDGSITGVIGALCNCTDAAKNISPPYGAVGGVLFETFTNNYLYVSGSADNIIYQCQLDATTGLFTACVDSNVAPGDGVLYDIPGLFSFELVGSNLFAFVTSTNGSTPNPPLVSCPVNATTGLVGPLASCTSFTTFASTEKGIAFDTKGGQLYAYIGYQDDAVSIKKCPVANDGSISSCIAPFGNPLNLNVQTISGPASVAYVTQNGGSGIMGCLLDASTGAVTGCRDAGTRFQFPSPTAIGFQTLSGPSFAYIADDSLNTVTQCTQDTSTGVLSSCTNTTSVTDPASIRFSTVSGTTYIYVTSTSGNSVTKCTVNASTGVLSSCATTGTVFSQPSSIAFGTGATHALIPDAATNIVMMCPVSSLGVLGPCVNSGATSIATPGGITLQEDGASVWKAYITNTASGNNTVTSCTYNTSTGLLSSCSALTGPTTAFTGPGNIQFADFSGTTYGYVTNSASGVNTVNKCTMNSDGTFNTCVDSAGGAHFGQPLGLAFYNPFP